MKRTIGILTITSTVAAMCASAHANPTLTEISLAMTSLMVAPPKTLVTASSTATGDDEADCQGTNIQASVIALKFDQLEEEKIARVEQAVAAVQGVMRATYDRELATMTVLVDASSNASEAKLIKYLDLAGYKARAATEEELDQALEAMRSGGAIVIRKDAEPERITDFPGTPAGRTAKAFIDAFNSGDEETMRNYSENHRSKSALESRSMEERLGQYGELYSGMGKLDVRRIEPHDELNVTVTVKPERGYSGLAMTFQCETAAPNKLEEVRITPTFLEDDKPADENFDESEMGDVTLLTESLKPLQDHFNANKGKYRFVAILSPT